MKAINRLTVKEVNDFKPSFDNPLVVECDDGTYDTDSSKEIKIISPEVGNYFSTINNHGFLDYLSNSSLHHYPSKIQPKEKVRFYQYEKGISKTNHYYSDCGKCFILNTKKLINDDFNPIWIKTSCYIEVEV